MRYGGEGWVVCLNSWWSSVVEELLDVCLYFSRWFDVVKRGKRVRSYSLKKKKKKKIALKFGHCSCE